MEILKNGQIIETIIPGQVLHPFKDFKSLPSIEALNKKGTEFVFEKKYDFKGTILSVVIDTETEPERLDDLATPLGRTQVVRSFDNDTETAEQYPLIVGIHMKYLSLDNYREVKNWSLELDLNGKLYYLSLEGIDSQSGMEKSIQEHGNEKNGKSSFDYLLRDENGDDKSVLLPFNAEALQNISAKIVKKEFPLE